MEFTLYIKDEVKSNGTTRQKHILRLKFHKQLKQLWELDWWSKGNSKVSWLVKSKRNKLYRKHLQKHFICLVRENMHTYAELSINFYVPKNTSFNDIDNKLKTICDALQLPNKSTNKNDNSKDNFKIENWEQKNAEYPLICLLENDNLIYKLNTDVDFILDEDFFKNSDGRRNRNSMLCIINVKIKGNLQLEQEYNDLII
jgi:hypothetical protein